MKKYILVFSVVVIGTASLMAQEKTRQDYLQVAKKQKIIGIGLIGAGVGTAGWV